MTRLLMLLKKWWEENPDKRKDGRWEERLVKEATQGTSTATSWTTKTVLKPVGLHPRQRLKC